MIEASWQDSPKQDCEAAAVPIDLANEVIEGEYR